MKNHLSTIVFGSLGLCAGFTLCYVYLVIPERETNRALSFPPQTFEQAHVTVTITRDGSMYFRNKRVELPELISLFKSYATNGVPLVIRAAKDAKYSRIVSILDACRTAGVENVAYEAIAVE